MPTCEECANSYNSYTVKIPLPQCCGSYTSHCYVLFNTGACNSFPGGFPCTCFPAAASVRRMMRSASGQHIWQTVTMSELRIGDEVECVLPQRPAWLVDGPGSTPVTGGSVASAYTTCRVYTYGKAQGAADVSIDITTLTYHLRGNSSATISASPGHHFFAASSATPSSAPSASPPSGLPIRLGDVQLGDLVTVHEPGYGFYTSPVMAKKHSIAPGAFSPYLTGGGLLVVDGAVMYPTSNWDTDMEAKHWGQHYVQAPLFQALEAAVAQAEAASSASGSSCNSENQSCVNSSSACLETLDMAESGWPWSGPAAECVHLGSSLGELGSSLGGMRPYVQLMKRITAAAEAQGRTWRDWRSMAIEMHAGSTHGKVYSAAEALQVFDRHHKVPAWQQQGTTNATAGSARAGNGVGRTLMTAAGVQVAMCSM